jgi:hypothetical protein
MSDAIPKYVFRGEGVQVGEWLMKHPRFRKQIIHNMRRILDKIHIRYPSFRHMNLNSSTVFYNDGRLKLSHFEHARMDSSIPKNHDLMTFIKSLGEPSAAEIARRLTS